VFHPTRLRIVLFEFLAGESPREAPVVKQNGP